MDGRYSHHGYKYLIQFSKVISRGTGVLDFDRSRRWFNSQFGWSQDVETRAMMLKNRDHFQYAYQSEDINPIWAYCFKYGDYRIYVDSDQTLSWFVLAHPNESNS